MRFTVFRWGATKRLVQASVATLPTGKSPVCLLAILLLEGSVVPGVGDGVLATVVAVCGRGEPRMGAPLERTRRAETIGPAMTAFAG